MLVKADGSVTNTYTYSTFGTTLTSSEATGASQPYRYAGGYTDVTTGLVKLGRRYYDSATARFTQLDSTGQDALPYGYAANSPESQADPTGASPGGAIASEVVGGLGAVGTAVACAATAGVGCLVAGVVIGAIAGDAGGAIGARIDGEVNKGTSDAAVDGAISGAVGGLVRGAAGKLAKPFIKK